MTVRSDENTAGEVARRQLLDGATVEEHTIELPACRRHTSRRAPARGGNRLTDAMGERTLDLRRH